MFYCSPIIYVVPRVGEKIHFIGAVYPGSLRKKFVIVRSIPDFFRFWWGVETIKIIIPLSCMQPLASSWTARPRFLSVAFR
jgi:hypothetical protein